jgi:transposase
MQARRTEMTNAKAARVLGVVDQTLFSWVKASRQGKLTGVDSSP